ncbi:hypothetical protein [Roseomonas indoligenes]|uniref:Tetratricopeptide repeat protein n=1 Tax=Roseomonas indoligenes TaxID=2820811 RepID=A0A940S3Q6_9PROT|nr:hypothetical protein [Pararoseomonas indoligenes]MBP0492491.1 hypothetical protein [Pararoseomonas indoligenes]
MRGAAFLALCGPLLLTAPALAERVAVRVGSHPGHGRIVLDLAAPNVAYRVEEGPDGALLHLTPGLEADLAAARRPPRNVTTLEATGEGLRLRTRPGTRLRHYRLGNRLVLDVLDAATSQPPPARIATPQPSAALPPARLAMPEPAPPRLATAPAPPPPAPAGPAAPSAAPAPVAPEVPAGLPLRTVAAEGGRALLLPGTEAAGLAILRRGELLLLVLDGPHPLDPSPLRDDPVFAGLRVQRLPEATLLTLPMAAPAGLAARRQDGLWLITPVSAARRERSILAEPEEGRVVLRAAAPGRPVPVLDPETGLPLLLGTVREPGQAVPLARSLAQTDLIPTQLGIAALARADSVALRRAGDRFVLSGATGATLPDLTAEAGTMTRLMDLPALQPGPSQERLRAQAASLAAAPPLARLPLRRAAAEGLLALGLAQEAQSMMRLAFQEDPRSSTDARSLLVHAAAALLAGRAGEAQALRGTTLPANDEVALWRAALAASAGEASAAAPDFAATLPLLLAYPEPLRARLLPLAANSLLESGDLPAGRRLLRAAGERPDLALATARLAEAEGRTEEALDRLSRIAEGRDRLARAQALRRQAEIRLAGGAITPAAAAASLEASLFAWRGDLEEFGTRLRIAALRQTAGDGRGALDLLKETAETYPDRLEQLRPLQEAALLQVMAGEPPTLAAALVEANTALLPAGARGADALLALAERLGAMELPDRAAALAAQAVDRAPGEARPALALRLAALRLAAGDAPGAVATIEKAPPTPGQAVEHGLLLARAKTAQGSAEEALAVLRGLGTPGLPALANLLSERQDWPGASDALLALAAARPEDPSTAPDLLRATAFAALAGDPPRLAAIRATWLPKLGTGALADAVGLLTADPLRGLSDLPRLQRELDLFRGFPERLEAFRTAAASSR